MLRNLFCIFTACAWTVVCFPVTLGIMVLRWNRSASMRIVQRWWSPVLLWAGGARLEVSGLDQLDPKRPYIFISNHQSTIDIPALFVALRDYDVRFVAKKALQYVPFLGWYMWLARFVFVDRGNHREAVRSLDEAGAQIRSGISIIVFPEGTRSDSLAILPFKKGPFALAMKAGVPVVPVAIEGSGKLMPKNSWNITPGPIRIRAGSPMDPAQYGDDRIAFITAVRTAIIDLNVSLGGQGGDRNRPIAARGLEGIARDEEGARA